ncbi:hypothetical protein KPL70_011534 [Citrus sinensis]|nr:hypothetical protein KPL70_011534 [Citrus sinensis]
MEEGQLGMSDKLHQIKAALSKLAGSISASKGTPSFNNYESSRFAQYSRSEEGNRPQFISRSTKLECPKFAGGDPTEWHNRILQFFEYQESTDEQKVSLASFHLEGEANQWWQWLRRAYREENKLVTWNDFMEELWARFRPMECEDYNEALSRVKQIGTLRDYQREFERLGNRVSGWTQGALVGTFMGGLKPEIANEIRMKTTRPPFVSQAVTNPTTTNRSPTTSSIKRLPWEEMQRRRALGLCFNCNKRFTAGHKCQGPQLLLLEVGAADNENANNEQTEEIQTEPEITYYTLMGWTAPQTMRVSAKIGPSKIVVLIDSGSTHNFISSRLANLLQLLVLPTSGFSVKVANSETLLCKGKFKKVQLFLQDIPFILTLYALPITRLDLVLGIHWLEQLGSVVCNWKQLTMEFDWENQKRQLQGIGPQAPQLASLTEISHDAKQRQQGFTICFNMRLELALSKMASDMQSLLEEYSTLFQEPTHLPPSREIEHNITLKEGIEPVNVRPYRYAHFQKDEIERQVNKMLNSGLIQPSTSPFSSLVLLVKKKDESWRFCTDYRALNKVTVKDRFPIPTVDDMLDELHGATYFTKLNLRAGYHEVRVKPTDVYKTAFRTHNGHYEYLVSIWEQIKHTAVEDDYVKRITSLAHTQDTRPYVIRQGLVFFKGRVVVPLKLRETLIFEAHDTKMGGHSGVFCTFKRLATQFYWPSMYKTIYDYVSRLSKYAHFMALTHPFTAKTVAERFVDGVVKHHGMPESIISDRDPIFISKFWQEFFQMSGTKLKLSLAYHPQTDGQTEVTNRCLEQYLRSFVHQWPCKWNSYLPWAAYWYNTTYHESTSMTPFLALYGRKPPTLPMYHEGSSPVHEVDQALLTRDELLQLLKSNLAAAINRMKQSADKRRRDVQFQPGNMVYLKLQLYRQAMVFRCAHQKLASKYFGPYLVLERIGSVAYKLRLPVQSRVHPIFHVSLLKKFISDNLSPGLELPSVDDDGLIILEPAAIIDVRWIKRGGKFVEQCLVQWKRLTKEEATWEDVVELTQKFPHLSLVDKGPLPGGRMIGLDAHQGYLSLIPCIKDTHELLHENLVAEGTHVHSTSFADGLGLQRIFTC